MSVIGGRSKTAIAGGVGLGATVLFAPTAQAATLPVTKLDDTDDGACNEDCSLREALDIANDDAEPDTIVFASGLSGTITLNTYLQIQAATTITGPGPDVLTVSGDDSDRVFYAVPDIEGAKFDPVSISGLTVRDGNSGGDGGGMYSLYATLTLDNMVFADNESGSAGGGLFADEGKLFITNSRFSGNEATGGWGGGLYLQDTEGSTADDVEFEVRNSVFTGNYASFGGGAIVMDDTDGDVVVQGTTVSGNTTDSNNGGGISFFEVQNGDVTLRNSTVSGNTSATYGGGVYFGDIEGASLVENTTISGNQAQEGGGGVIFYDHQNEATVRNSTIVGNVAGLDAGDYAGGGILVHDDGTDDADDGGPVQVSSTIVAGNSADTGPDLGEIPFAEGFNVGFSLIGDPAGATITTTGPNLTGVDPQLGPLANNGGATLTHAPSFTSPVIDAGVANGVATDQRGAPRTFDAANFANAAGGDGTDIGSVELLPGGRLSLAQCKGAAENVLFAPGTAIVGSDANDVIVGTEAKDQINSGKGKDRVCAAGGNDAVKAGAGKDNVAGQAGKDRLKGNGGNDKLQGNAGRDTLKGGGGKDTLKGGGGKDKLRGGPGKDKLKGGGGKDSEVQ